MSAIWRALRNHLQFLLIALVLTIIMTWPTAVHVFDTERFWLPTRDWDVFIEIWDAWHGSRAFNGLTAFNRSDVLFHPVGLSLNHHPYNVFHMLMLMWLQTLWPVANAYNFIYLTFVFATALSGYLFLIYWLRDKWLALFGAVILGFSQHVVGHPQHPASLIATLPLAICAMHLGVLWRSWKWLAAAGVLVGMTALVSIYGFLCLVLTVGMLSLYFALSRWRRTGFWIGLAVMLIVAGSISMIRIYPILQDQGSFGAALAKGEGRESANDLLGSFVNYRHPITTPLFVELLEIDTSDDRFINGWRHTSFLGYLPLILALIGLLKSRDRRQLLPWLFLFGAFFVLRLGSELRVNDVIYSGAYLPKHYLDKLFPALFEVVYETDHYQVGLLIPLAILSCAGLRVVLSRLPPRYHSVIILLAIAIVAFEYYYSPFSLTVAGRRLDYSAWLKSEPDQDEIRLINLPMGRTPSKLYGFLQTQNGYPHAEGLAMRTPPGSYEFIRNNIILRAWSDHRDAIQCSVRQFDEYLQAARQLEDVGFSHVVLHRHLEGADKVRGSFELVSPVYQDRFAEVYSVKDLYDACADWKDWLESESTHLRRFLQSYENAVQPRTLLLNFQPGDQLRDDARGQFSKKLAEWDEWALVFDDDQGIAVAQYSASAGAEGDSVPVQNRIVWLLYNPLSTALQTSAIYAEALAGRLHSCQRIEEAEELTIDIHIDRDFPCALVTGEDPFAVRYDNGIQLANILHEMEDKSLAWYLWWSDEPVRGFAYSIQLNDASGAKVLQLDDVIRAEPLARHEMDLSGLAAGEYRANLIVYDHESGQSQPGTVLATGQEFQRELQIASFLVD